MRHLANQVGGVAWYYPSMKSLLLGIVFIVVIGVGGLVYRNAIEHSFRPIACPLDALLCPDGTAVARQGLSCTFPACPSPNVSFANVDIAFVVPTGFTPAPLPDSASVVAYEMSTAPLADGDAIVVRSYNIPASSTALATIQQTAIGGASGVPVSATSFTSTVLGTYRFTVVSIERFEGVIDTAYYLARAADVLRFDAIDRGVTNWMDTNLETSTLPAHAALQKLLATLQGS